MINFEETELRLGLPGGSSSSNDGELSSSSGLKASKICGNNNINNKRGFSETNNGGVDLKLNLCSSSNNKDNLGSVSASCVVKENNKISSRSTHVLPPPPSANDPAKPPAKAQVVGWPPVRSFRKNIVNSNNVQRSSNIKKEEEDEEEEKATSTIKKAVSLVKVSVDGAPYLRKVDLKQYKSYKELSDALANMFSVNCGSLSNSSDYVPTYQDKDGDWMLAGDVPWEMFVESCKRLRMMKGSEAIGLGKRQGQ